MNLLKPADCSIETKIPCEMPRWVDTLSGPSPPTTYTALTSKFCRLIPFMDYIVGKTSVVNIISSLGSNVTVEIHGRFMAKKGTIARSC
jgi:hypothetical protein